MANSKANLKNTIEFVVPCFNEEEVLPLTVPTLLDLLSRLISDGLVDSSSSIIFVDDGSTDKTWELIQDYSANSQSVVGLRLAQNAGHQNALLAGLEYSSAEITLSIDADLQDDLDVIPEMIRKALNGCDVVYGVRSDRSSDSWFKRITAEAY